MNQLVLYTLHKAAPRFRRKPEKGGAEEMMGRATRGGGPPGEGGGGAVRLTRRCDGADGARADCASRVDARCGVRVWERPAAFAPATPTDGRLLRVR